MKRHFRISMVSFCLLSMLISLNGCFPDGKNINENTNSLNNTSDLATQEDIPSHLKEDLLDNLSIDADISFPKNVQWKTYDATLKVFINSDEVNSTFLNGQTIEDQHSYGDGTTIDSSATYRFPDGSGVWAGVGMMGYSRPESSNRFYRQMLEAGAASPYLLSDLAYIYKKTDIDGIDKDNAINLVKEKVLGLGLSVSDTPAVYALDYDTFKNFEENLFFKDGTTANPWTKDDEAYVIQFQGIKDNLPISDKGYINAENGGGSTGERIYGIVSKDGLIEFDCNGIYDISDSSNNVNIISLNTAKEAIKAKYSNIILTSPIVISSISAELVPECVSVEPLKFKLTPAWTFYLNQEISSSKDGEEQPYYRSNFCVFINAVTGEEIRSGGAM